MSATQAVSSACSSSSFIFTRTLFFSRWSVSPTRSLCWYSTPNISSSSSSDELVLGHRCAGTHRAKRCRPTSVPSHRCPRSPSSGDWHRSTSCGRHVTRWRQRPSSGWRTRHASTPRSTNSPGEDLRADSCRWSCGDWRRHAGYSAGLSHRHRYNHSSRYSSCQINQSDIRLIQKNSRCNNSVRL